MQHGAVLGYLAIPTARDVEMRSERRGGRGHDVLGPLQGAQQVDQCKLERLACQQFVTVEQMGAHARCVPRGDTEVETSEGLNLV